MKMSKNVMALVVSAAALVAASGLSVRADDKAEPATKMDSGAEKLKQKMDDKEAKLKELKEKKLDKMAEKGASPVAIGQPAPGFELRDTDGTAFTLEQFTKEGKIVVLEWFNPDCPFIKKHHELSMTFNNLHDQFADKGVVFLAINSSASGMQGHGIERNKKAKADFKMAYPILIDEAGTVGRAYGAKTTPHCFVIGKDGKMAYMGAIDDDRSPDKAGKINHVEKALTELVAGQTVSKDTTQPYGCSVKYGKN